ncbi:MAG: hypothetical protein EKK48_29915 [Candidatus Melainabacteria bacterium]|nr:MAG: hypothetical protein EKK48_29915 [Candidatus Melainabacteria bacterium]
MHYPAVFCLYEVEPRFYACLVAGQLQPRESLDTECIIEADDGAHVIELIEKFPALASWHLVALEDVYPKAVLPQYATVKSTT